MSQQSCCVPTCTVTLGDGVLLHRFPNPSNPKEIERFRTWVIKIGGEIVGRDDLYIYDNRRICHNHFEEVFIYPTTRRLSKLAIPSLNLSGVYRQLPERLPHNILNEQQPMQVQMDINIQSNIASQVEQLMELPTSSQKDNESHLSFVLRKTSIPMTKTEMKLKKVIIELKNKLRKTQKGKDAYKMQLSLEKRLQKSKAFNILVKNMSQAAKTFFSMQIKESHKKPRGRRFSLDEKILALSLYKPSPKAYVLLSNICLLPKKRTLDKLLQKIHIRPGINESLFNNLKKRVSKMPTTHKFCAIIFDEMAIAPSLTYDKKNDIIHGFVDNGQERKKEFCDHVLVFMVRGVVKKFKQPISFTFCKGSTKTHDLKRQIISVIMNVQATGLKVVSTVCDQGSSNMAAINLLLNNTKDKYLRKNKSYTDGFFEIKGKKIFPIFDPPHLMKGIRNNLINKDLEYKLNQKTCKATWDHILAMYRRGPEYKGVRLKLVHKLTAQHVVPSLIPKMRVKHCTQVFSESVGSAMGFMSEMGKLPKETCETADILMFFDKLFDSVNGNFSKPRNGKILRSAVTPRSPHLKFWNSSLPVLRSMKFITKKGKKGTVPSISSWIKTIIGFQKIIKCLQDQGVNSLLLRNFNQDPLENFFGAIRAHGVRNVMPNAVNFINSYKSLLINNLTSPHSVGANCEDDKTKHLQLLKRFLRLELSK